MMLAAGLLQSTNALTTGGLAVGLILLVWHVGRWWYKPGGGGAAPAAARGPAAAAPTGRARNPKDLLPFGCGIGWGTLMVACPAGILGTTAGLMRNGSNAGGGLALSKVTGTQAQTIAQASTPHLTAGGGVLVLVTLGLIVALWKKLSKLVKGKFAAGTWCGATLAVGSGLAAVFGQLVIPLYNSGGDSIFGGALSGGLFV